MGFLIYLPDNQSSKTMKFKLLSLAVVALIIYSCASKSSVPTLEVKPSEPAVTTMPTVAGPTVMTAELVEGKDLYEKNCAHCHKLFDPKDFSREEWKPIVLSMQKKAHLDDVQGQKIYNYLTMN